MGLIGKSLLVTGPKAVDLEELDGKQVLAQGAFFEEKMSLDLESVKTPPVPKPQGKGVI